MMDPIFNMFKVKFDVMDKLGILNKTADKVVIYINLEMVMKVLLNPKLNNQLKATGDKNLVKMSIMSNIVNLAQHYRLYCVKHKMDSRIVLYWNYPKGNFINEKYIEDYRFSYTAKLFKNINCDYILDQLDNCYEFLTTMVKYLDQVYLINHNSIESSVIPLILQNEVYSQQELNIQSILITNSKYEYQYVGKGFDILEPNSDDSTWVTEDNVSDILRNKQGIRTEGQVPTKLIPFALSLLGDKYRNIPKMSGVGMGHIIKILKTSIDKLIITPNTTNEDILSQLIRPELKDQFINNYRCTNIDLQLDDIGPSEINDIKVQIEDKFDDNTMRAINDRYFKRCPLMLIDTRKERIIKESKESKQRSIFERR